MSTVTKKIDTALKELTKALEKHAQLVGLKPVPLKKAGRAAAELRSAAATYANLVEAKTGQRNPFIDFLDPATIASLSQERDALAARTVKDELEAELRSTESQSAEPGAGAARATSDV